MTGNPSQIETGYFLLFTDATMKSDGKRTHGQEPGEAGIGGVLKDRKLRTIDTISQAIGPAHITVAEYRALIEGLKLARHHGVEHVRAFLDSEVVVDQVSRSSGIQPHHEPLRDEVDALIQTFGSFRIAWVPREMNKEADSLAGITLN